LLAEDHPIVRLGIRALLQPERDIEVVGEAATGREAVQLTRKLRPAVVVMDIAMPLLNGLEATRQIRKDFPDTRVLIHSAYNDPAYVEQAVRLGAAGYLLKHASPDRLATAIREVLKGNTFVSDSPSIPLHGRAPEPLDQSDGQLKKRTNRLSSREAEVLQLIAEGRPNKQVAAELGLSFKTVDKYRQHLMAKLNIHNVASLTRYAISAGIIESRAQAARF
jgi:DNA-binding NarL/FixJ family response regulator